MYVRVRLFSDRVAGAKCARNERSIYCTYIYRVGSTHTLNSRFDSPRSGDGGSRQCSTISCLNCHLSSSIHTPPIRHNPSETFALLMPKLFYYQLPLIRLDVYVTRAVSSVRSARSVRSVIDTDRLTFFRPTRSNNRKKVDPYHRKSFESRIVNQCERERVNTSGRIMKEARRAVRLAAQDSGSFRSQFFFSVPSDTFASLERRCRREHRLPMQRA